MKNLFILFFLVLLMVVPSLNARADFTKTKVAVLDFQVQGSSYDTENMGVIVAEWFITALVKTGRFDVIERALLQKILSEQKMSLTGIIDESSSTQFGKILGVKIVISGSVMKIQNILEINARIIDVQTGSIIAAENVKSTISSDLQSLIVQMSEKIVKNFPLEGYVVTRKGKTAFIDLGKLAGVQPEMEFVVYKEGEVIKHPKTGEVLDVEKIQVGKLKITKIRNKIAEGEILGEEIQNTIAVGQMVQSISGPLNPISTGANRPTTTTKSSRPTTTTKTTAFNSVTALTQPSTDPEDTHSAGYYISKINSNSSSDEIMISKKIIEHRPDDPGVYTALEKVLLKTYNNNIDDRYHVDAVSWMAKALAASRMPQYIATLELIAQKADNGKVKKYAKIALDQLIKNVKTSDDQRKQSSFPKATPKKESTKVTTHNRHKKPEAADKVKRKVPLKAKNKDKAQPTVPEKEKKEIFIIP